MRDVGLFVMQLRTQVLNLHVHNFLANRSPFTFLAQDNEELKRSHFGVETFGEQI